MVIEEEVGNQTIEQSGQSIRTCVLLKYSICKSLEHTARTCSERQ